MPKTIAYQQNQFIMLRLAIAELAIDGERSSVINSQALFRAIAVRYLELNDFRYFAVKIECRCDSTVIKHRLTCSVQLGILA